MISDEVKGHLSVGVTYTIFGLNVVLCKDQNAIFLYLCMI